jgi:hypothetical protein
MGSMPVINSDNGQGMSTKYLEALNPPLSLGNIELRKI